MPGCHVRGVDTNHARLRLPDAQPVIRRSRHRATRLRLKQTKQKRPYDEIPLTRLLTRLHSSPCFTGIHAEEQCHDAWMHSYRPIHLGQSAAC